MEWSCAGEPPTGDIERLRRDESDAGRRVAGQRGDRDDRLEHLIEGHRAECDHLGAAAEMIEGLIDVGDIDRAHRTQVLGHDDVGSQVA
jgi:hypothetical protein